MSFSLLLYGIVWGTLVLTLKDLVEYISEYFQFWPFLCGEPLCYCFNLTDFLYEFFKIYFLCVCVCICTHLLVCVSRACSAHGRQKREDFSWNWNWGHRQLWGNRYRVLETEPGSSARHTLRHLSSHKLFLYSWFNLGRSYGSENLSISSRYLSLR